MSKGKRDFEVLRAGRSMDAEGEGWKTCWRRTASAWRKSARRWDVDDEGGDLMRRLADRSEAGWLRG